MMIMMSLMKGGPLLHIIVMCKVNYYEPTTCIAYYETRYTNTRSVLSEYRGKYIVEASY